MRPILTLFFIVLSFIAIILVGINGLNIGTGSGEHTGYITSVEKNGLIFKTGRAYVKTDLQSSQEDMYCITDESLYKELEVVSRSKEPVTLKYHSKLIYGATNCSSEGAIIDSFLTTTN